MGNAQTQTLHENFEAQAEKPELLAPKQYYDLLTRLVKEGKGFGKSSPVAAYKMQSIKVVNEEDDAFSEIAVEPVYLCLDPKWYPNEYARKLVVKDILAQVARSITGEEEINQVHYRGPGIWTSKTKGFEEDYLPRGIEKDEYGHTIHIHRPNPNAYRLCLTVDKAFKMPTQWGEYTVCNGGTVAVREKDIPSLTKALRDVREGRKTIQQALYKKGAEGRLVAKFDVYGMAKGFLEENYGPVMLKRQTIALQDSFSVKRDVPTSARKTNVKKKVRDAKAYEGVVFRSLHASRRQTPKRS